MLLSLLSHLILSLEWRICFVVFTNRNPWRLFAPLDSHVYRKKEVKLNKLFTSVTKNELIPQTSCMMFLSEVTWLIFLFFKKNTWHLSLVCVQHTWADRFPSLLHTHTPTGEMEKVLTYIQSVCSANQITGPLTKPMTPLNVLLFLFLFAKWEVHHI